jgi:hypothetical protein
MGTDIKITKKIGVKNQNAPITTDTSNINFEGSGVTATAVGNEVTVTITGSGTGGGATNLSYLAAIYDGTVTSDTGTDATIPLADTINAGLMLAEEKIKLTGIEAGAEVNVNADWNATSGDAEILNKPAIPAAQVNADWLATSGLAEILNKPASIPTANVAHSVKYAEALTIGQAVYISSADGTNMLVSKADNSSEATSSKTLGLVTATGAANYQGQVITEGLLAGLDTSAATDGDAVWLGTNGNLIFWHYGLTTKPVAPAHLVFIGIVTRVNLNNGEIFVKAQNGFEIDELHDVSVVGRADNGLLGYVSSTGLHVFKTVAQWLGYTPANKAGETFTGAISATNLSGSNNGDDAINTLYSGLATSKQDALTLTTTGTSGAATLTAGTLNIPQYSGGSGTVPESIINSSLIFYSNNC